MATNPVERPTNPFEVTKATDFNDAQIAATWVDLPSGGGFRSVIDPTSPVTRFILGGKGSGRTHLLRYYSSHLQAMRLQRRGAAALSAEGYVGVYVNSSTLNPGRFSGKGQSDDTWRGVFAYYLDVVLALRTLLAVDQLWVACGEGSGISDAVREGVHEMFDVGVDRMDGLIGDLRGILRKMDGAINAAALSRELEVRVGATPGRLVFGTVGALRRVVGALAGLQFALLVDEFENFSELQQSCVQTLVREKDGRVSFLVGARTFGVRTTQTAGGERNREGSEYETIELDSLFRRRRADYESFCRALVGRRLTQAGVGVPEGKTRLAATLRAYFVDRGGTGSSGADTSFVKGPSEDQRECLVRLRGQLAKYRPAAITDVEIDRVVGNLHWAEGPVVEKVGVYLLYRAWHRRGNVVAAAADIAAERSAFLGGDRSTTFGTTIGHFRGDMVAQLLAEYKQKQRYLGFSECVALSGGLPRGLLVVLKHVCRWAVFNGEEPFAGGHAISEESQRAGIREAGRWFLTDLSGIGPYGVQARDAMERLGGFLRALRFADKPTESSACTVSLDRRVLSARVCATVDHCIESSFLLSITGGHRGRNTGVRKEKLQLHPMLCPRWDLPTGRRGVVELSAEEASAIFDSKVESRLQGVVRARLARMSPPFGLGSEWREPGLGFNGGL